jgi:glutaconyl-CoA/methylmalonyl-CoA decarboxylase subunit delta
MNSEFLSDGVFISIVGMVVVFISLVILALLFGLIPKIMQYVTKQQLKKEGKEVEKDMDLDVSVEVNAVIGAALFMYFNEIHDEESHEMTIKKILKTYSPWSSKIYSMNSLQNKY